MDISSALHWRYATKKFDPTRSLTEEEVDELLDAARLAPSSFGLAPWRFVLVKDPQLRRQIYDEAGHQSQMVDASHLVVLCAHDDITPEMIDSFIELTASTRGISVLSLNGFRKSIEGFRESRSPQERRAWCERQTYIALGVLLETAALRQIDACPMEGFENTKADAILGLSKYGVHSLAMVALGHRASDDPYASAAKVRAPRSEVVVEK